MQCCTFSNKKLKVANLMHGVYNGFFWGGGGLSIFGEASPVPPSLDETLSLY